MIALQIVFAILGYTGVVDWPLWAILLPTWIWLAALVVGFAIGLAGYTVKSDCL